MNTSQEVLVAARAFGVAAALGVMFLLGGPQNWVAAIALITTAAAAATATAGRPSTTGLVVVVEALLAAAILGLSLPGGVMILPYTMTIFLSASLTAGKRGLLAVTAIQPVAITMAFRATHGVWLERGSLLTLLPWFLTGFGLGLLGLWVRRQSALKQDPDDVAMYAAAHRLLTQLRPLAGRLSSGLDPGAVGSQIVAVLEAANIGQAAGVFLRTESGHLVPLAANRNFQLPTTSSRASIEKTRGIRVEHEKESGTNFVFMPLLVGSRQLGEAIVRTSCVPDPEILRQVGLALNRHTFSLEAALVFDEIRSMATVEERRRLAREIHDGIAQEIAALGYHADSILAYELPAEVTGSLQQLRSELTRVVRELRLSIFDLRHDLESGDGFGAALSEYVRRVGNQSDFAVHLSLDERGRLRPETELELLRISQEAVTNVRKHAHARNLWVTCRIWPPFAEIEISDDGIGLSSVSEPNSYGLSVMRERAERIDARLEIAINDSVGISNGTRIRVSVGCPAAANHQEVV